MSFAYASEVSNKPVAMRRAANIWVAVTEVTMKV